MDYKYHTINEINHFEFGECLTMLYVSKDPLDWEGERREVVNREPWVYVWNKTFDYESESGYIRVKPQFGGLIRTC